MASRSSNRRGDAPPPSHPDDPSSVDLDRAISALPAQPGVYLFRDGKGTLLYVGKAKRLDQRVRSHFQDPASIGPKQVALIRRVESVDFIAVDSEIDALILESTLVREQQPPYNIHLKDDKRYPYIRVSWQEPYPKLTIVRHTNKDGARYFGPYTEVKSLRALLRLTQTIFPMRTCADIDAHIAARRECLEFHIGRCTGPCIEAQSREEYRAMVDQFCDFLAGKRDEVVARLRSLQATASERRDYERAARLRDQVRHLESVLARQRMVDVGGTSIDVLGLARQGDRCCVVVLKVRERRVVSREVRWLQGGGIVGEADLLRAFVTLTYAQPDSIPETIVVETDPDEGELVRSYLAQNAAGAVRVRQPRDAAERALLRMARRNAVLLSSRGRETSRRGLEQSAADEALELQRALDLSRLPRRIRCFDVSQLFGTHVVASMVTFVDGRPAKGEYRRFRIRTVVGQDDFASIAEAVQRHATRVGEGEMVPADLILIDGGAGQLSAALGAAQGTVHGEAVRAQRAGQEVHDARLVVDDQQSLHRRPISRHRGGRDRGGRTCEGAGTGTRVTRTGLLTPTNRRG